MPPLLCVVAFSKLAKIYDYIFLFTKDFLESSAGHMAGGVNPLRPLSSPPALPVSPFLSVSPSPSGPLVPFPSYGHCNKNYTKRDMSLALEALR